MKKKVSERLMTSKQQITQMQHYWDNLFHLTPDKDKKKNLERRFGIKNIKVDNRGNILSFEEVELDELDIGAKICDVPVSSLRSPLLKKLHKKKCDPEKEKDTVLHRAAKKAKMGRKERDRLYNSFEQFLEAKQKTVVFSFGRLNPPTTGHQKLLQKIIQVAKQQSGQPKLFVSYSQDVKKNPLTAKQKIAYIKKMFPKEARQIEMKDDSSIKNAMDIATVLNGKYDNLVMVVGSDRVRDFKTLLNKYNGVES
ncbi:uncharacterized protein METZ01_LOCUS422779, partial [marine metagenome]